MVVKIAVDPLGDLFESKKKPGFFLRQVLCSNGQGGRSVIMIGSANAALLSALKTGSEIALKPAGDFFFAV